MALSKVSILQEDGNLFSVQEGQDHISALIFDVSTFPVSGSNTGANGDVYEIFSTAEAEELGITEYTTGGASYKQGIPHYHIAEFFRMNPTGHLFVGFKDMTTDNDFNFVADIQRASQGRIRQVGVLTDQKLFTPGATENDPYTLNLVTGLQSVADAMDDEEMPLSIVLQAGTTAIEALTGITDLSKLPSILTASNKNVTVLLGQGNSAKIREMQAGNGTDKNAVGCLGTAMGCIASATTGESIAWVSKFDISGGEMDTVALGFGDMTDTSGTDETPKNLNPLSLITRTELDALESKGYVFPMKYVGTAGTYFSSDRTCSTGDFNSISRNRVVDKTKRLVRATLIPTLNESLLIDGTTGQLAYSTVQRFRTLVSNTLTDMKPGELSDFQVFINPEQNILSTNKLVIAYSIVPLATNKSIQVKVGFTQKLNA